MNISSIKNRADELLVGCKPQVIRIMTIMMLIGLIPSLFSGSQNAFISLVSLVLSVVFLTFQHGYVVTTLKVVRNNATSITDDDALVGFKRFKELFPTYLVSGIVLFVVVAFLIFIVVFLTTMMFSGIIANVPDIVMNVALSQENAYSTLMMLAQIAPTFIFAVLFIALLVFVVVTIVSIYLFAVPYLLEQYNMKTTTALKESFAFMKKHLWDMIKLELSFIGWMILAVIIESVLANVLAFIPVLGSIIAVGLAGLFSIYTYLPKYKVSLAIFFEEIAYYRYDQPQMNNQGATDNA